MFGGGGGFNTARPGFGGAPSPFGTPQPAPANAFGSTPSAFGSTSTPFGAKPAGGGMFGSTPTTGFGAPTGGGLFGAPAAPTGGFGTPATAFGAAPATPFGAPASSPFGGGVSTGGFGATTSAFGAKTTPFGGGGTTFGAPAPATQASPFGGFGASTSTQSSPFGAKPATSFGAPATGGAFGGFGSALGGSLGGMGANLTGTGQVPFQPQRTDEKSTGNEGPPVLMSITGMKEYANKSFEELRMEDYLKGNKGGTAAAATGALGGGLTGGFGASTSGFGTTGGGLFGAAPAPASGGLFGAGTTGGGFGSTGFGAAAAPSTGLTFGAPAPAASPFGSTFGAPATTSPFGAKPATTFGSTTPAFGAAPAPTSFAFGAPAPAPSPFGAAPASGGLFGSAPAATPFGGGLAAPAPAAFGGFGSTGGFGAAPAPAPLAGFGGFGTPQPAPAPSPFGGFGSTTTGGGGLFGAAPATGAFGAPAPSLGFGAAKAPAPSAFGFGASPAPAPAGGTFGQSSNLFGSSFGSTLGQSKPAFSLGPSPAPAGNLFGSAPAGGGLFGSTPTGTTGGNLFGGFGSTTGGFGTQQTGGGLGFGMTSGFGQQQQQMQGQGGQMQQPLLASHNHGVFGGAVQQRMDGVNRILQNNPLEMRQENGGGADGSLSSYVGGPEPQSSTGVASVLKHTPRSTARIRPRGASSNTTSSSTLLSESALGGSSSMNGRNGGFVSPAAYLGSTTKRLVITAPPPPMASASTRSPPRGQIAGPSPAERTSSPVSSPQTDASSSSVNGAANGYSAFVPRLTSDAYVTTPEMSVLRAMNEDELKSVLNFSMKETSNNYGSIEWLEAVDLRGANLDKIVKIEQSAVSVYDGPAEEKAEVGKGLNMPALIKLNNIYPSGKSSTDPGTQQELDSFHERLRKKAGKMGATHVSYENGTWSFRVSHFSRYGLDDSDDEQTQPPASTRPVQRPTVRSSRQEAAAAESDQDGWGEEKENFTPTPGRERESGRDTNTSTSASMSASQPMSVSTSVSDGNGRGQTPQTSTRRPIFPQMNHQRLSAPGQDDIESEDSEDDYAEPMAVEETPSRSAALDRSVDFTPWGPRGAQDTPSMPPEAETQPEEEDESAYDYPSQPDDTFSFSLPPLWAPSPPSRITSTPLTVNRPRVPATSSALTVTPAPRQSALARRPMPLSSTTAMSITPLLLTTGRRAGPAPKDVTDVPPLVKGWSSSFMRECVGSVDQSASVADVGLRMGRSFGVSWGEQGKFVYARRTAGGFQVRIQSITTTPSRKSVSPSDLYEGPLFIHIKHAIDHAAPTTAPQTQTQSNDHMMIADAEEQEEEEEDRSAEVSLSAEISAGESASADPDVPEPPAENSKHVPRWSLPFALKREDPQYTAVVRCIQHYAAEAIAVTGGSPSDPEWVAAQAWSLCNALWGQEENRASGDAAASGNAVVADALPLSQSSQHDRVSGTGRSAYDRRCAAIAKWAANAVAHCATTHEDVGARGESLYRCLLDLLAVRRPDEAVTVAYDAGMPRLATMLSLVSSSSQPNTLRKDSVYNMVKQWQERGIRSDSPSTNSPIDTVLLLVYELLAGEPRPAMLPGPGRGLRWLQLFGMHMWYGNGDVKTALTAVHRSDDESHRPLARYLTEPTHYKDRRGGTQAAAALAKTYKVGGRDAEGRVRGTDVLFSLLELYNTQSPEAVKQALDPFSVSPDILDYRNAWHLLQVLDALPLPYGKWDPELLPSVATSFSFQLVNAGLWPWAAYVELCTPDGAPRARAIILKYGHSVLPCLTLGSDGDAPTHELLKLMNVPDKWLHESLAYKASYEGRFADAYQGFINAGMVYMAHEIVVQRLAPKYVLGGRDKYEALLDLFDQCGEQNPDKPQVFREFLEIEVSIERAQRGETQESESPARDIVASLYALGKQLEEGSKRTPAAPSTSASRRVSTAHSVMGQRVLQLLVMIATQGEGNRTAAECALDLWPAYGATCNIGALAALSEEHEMSMRVCVCRERDVGGMEVVSQQMTSVY